MSNSAEGLDGLELKVQRIRLGVKQFQLALRLALEPARLSAMESGRRPIPPELLKKIAEILSKWGRQ